MSEINLNLKRFMSIHLFPRKSKLYFNSSEDLTKLSLILSYFIVLIQLSTQKIQNKKAIYIYVNQYYYLKI